MLSDIFENVPPGAILLLGGLLVPLLHGRARSAYLLGLPLLSFVQWMGYFRLPAGDYLRFTLLHNDLVLARVDPLTLVFGLIFHIATFLCVLFALHVKDAVQQIASVVYAGAAIAALFAGDLLTLFVYWELTAVASVFLIWASRTERATAAGMRYLIVQVGSGVLLLAGIVVHLQQGGTLAFGPLGTEALGPQLILIAFGIKCAFPLLHNWVQDAYPEATPTGTVFLSSFTTKLAVYALWRGFAGTDSLIWIGAVMAVFPIFYGMLENDLRRVLAYVLNNQLGFMVVGVGLGTSLSLNGVAAHAFSHILYEGLLFMSMGALLQQSGTVQGSELGGLYKSMPWTAGLCLIGAASIAAFPLTIGFISKSMIVSAAAEEHQVVVWLLLLLASAGVFCVAGIRVPWLAFFGRDAGVRCSEAPGNMLIAMGATALLCLLIGTYPQPLYALLPESAEYEPYTLSHVITQLQLLAFAALAMAALYRGGLIPRAQPSAYLDSDWFYRRLAPVAIVWLVRNLGEFRDRVVDWGRGVAGTFLQAVYKHHGPQGVLARTWPTGSIVLWVAVLLGSFLVLYYT